MRAVDTGRVALKGDGVTGLSPADQWDVRRYEKLTTSISRVAVFLVGLDYVVSKGASLGLVIAAALLPIWISTLRRYRFATLIASLGVLSVPSGYLLSRSSSVDHAIDHNLRLSWFGLLLSGIAAMGLIFWARQRLPLRQVILLYGIGSLANAVLFSARSWKFDLAVPIILIVLSLVDGKKNRIPGVVALLGLGLFSVVNDGRSLLGFCAVAAMLTLWQLRPAGGTGSNGKSNRWIPLAVMAGVGFGLYVLGTTLLTGGALGTELQQRSIAQIDASGSLISGGRPEWAATRELVKIRPLGYGTGVVPGWSDLQAGRAGLESINVYAEGYANNYLFSGGFELHSIVADLWLSLGVVGLALGITMLVALLVSMSFRLAARDAPTSVLFAATLGIWYLLFGPIYSNWIEVCAAIGFSLVLRDRRSFSNEPVDLADPGA